MRKQDGARYEKVLMRTKVCQLNPGSTPANRTRIFAYCLPSLANYLQPSNQLHASKDERSDSDLPFLGAIHH
jgi:hypothetical protein